MNCRACKTNLKPFFSLGDMPLVNSFLRKEDIIREKKYDLTVGFCDNCYLAQLMHSVSPDELFRDYIYYSSTSSSLVDYNHEAAEYFINRFQLHAKSFVLEVASNDGIFLQFFKKKGIPVLGIDPARNIAHHANENGIETIPEFFNYSFAKQLKKQKGIQADLVYGANVLAHVPNIVDFVKGVKTILKPRGTAIFEFPYIEGLMENKFDTIYHEHVFYYSLIALQNLFAHAKLEIYDVELVETQGGSLRIFSSHPNVYVKSENINTLEKKEHNNNFDTFETYQKISQNIEELKEELLRTLAEIKNNGGSIAAYSAPAKGNILLNYFGISDNLLDFIVDKAEEKQGLYTPGTHMVVQSPKKIFDENPSHLLVLCWNIATEVKDEFTDYRKNGGKLIIPVPQVKIY